MHVHFATGGVNSLLDFDNNIYYPDGEGMFALAHRLSNFAKWKQWEVGHYVFDPNSQIADPLFVDVANNDFRLQAGSPAIDNGVFVSIEKDKQNNNLNGTPDIGAFEYAGIPTQPTPSTTQSEDVAETAPVQTGDAIIVEDDNESVNELTAEEISRRNRIFYEAFTEERLKYFGISEEEWNAIPKDEQQEKKEEFGKWFHNMELEHHDISHDEWQKLVYEQERDYRWKWAADYFGLDENLL